MTTKRTIPQLGGSRHPDGAAETVLYGTDTESHLDVAKCRGRASFWVQLGSARSDVTLRLQNHTALKQGCCRLTWWHPVCQQLSPVYSCARTFGGSQPLHSRTRPLMLTALDWTMLQRGRLESPHAEQYRARVVVRAVCEYRSTLQCCHPGSSREHRLMTCPRLFGRHMRITGKTLGNL